MVLLIAVLIGLTAGLCRAWFGKRKYRVFELKAPGLVLLAFIPQFLAFFLPATRDQIPDRLASILYISSLVILFAFSLINIRKTSFWPISIGFLLNALVILLNGGWMPISPEMVTKLNPNAPADSWQIGQRLGSSKDIVLTPETARLQFLSDRFSLPDWMSFQAAFSLGDVLIFLGVVWLLWSLGSGDKVHAKGDIE